MNKLLAPFLILTTLVLSGCDLSMNKNKGASTEADKKQDLLNLDPITGEAFHQDPILESELKVEPSVQTKQAEQWQEMNLATSSNDNGQSITLTETPTPLNFDDQPKPEDYFEDFKANE